MIPAKSFYLIRHGQTVANAANMTAGGGTDSPLNDIGHEQAKAIAAVIEQIPVKPTKIIHSPMSRARDTAGYINEKLGLEMIEIDNLREHMVGDWEGRPWDEIMDDLVSDVTPPNGESRSDYAQRVKTVLDEILEEHEGPIMIVAHGGTFYSIAHLYGHKLDTGINNCHLHFFNPEPGHPDFPWQVCQFDIEEVGKLVRNTAPFCPRYGVS